MNTDKTLKLLEKVFKLRISLSNLVKLFQSLKSKFAEAFPKLH